MFSVLELDLGQPGASCKQDATTSRSLVAMESGGFGEMQAIKGDGMKADQESMA